MKKLIFATLALSVFAVPALANSHSFGVTVTPLDISTAGMHATNNDSTVEIGSDYSLNFGSVNTGTVMALQSFNSSHIVSGGIHSAPDTLTFAPYNVTAVGSTTNYERFDLRFDQLRNQSSFEINKHEIDRPLVFNTNIYNYESLF